MMIVSSPAVEALEETKEVVSSMFAHGGAKHVHTDTGTLDVVGI
jgi:hypothetical protein